MAAPRRLITRGMQSAATARPFYLPPAFLLPSLAGAQSSSFSTSAPLSERRDRNKNRGVSALRRTGLRRRQTIAAKLENLPKPVLDMDRHTKVEVDPDHGLWQFFNRERTPFATPEYNNSHGRPWTVNELRIKDWEDLHRLWWVCVKERNRLATEEYERTRVDAGYGEHETTERDRAVKNTMRAIKHVLTEKWYTWENARQAAERDPEVNLYPEPGEEGYMPQSMDAAIYEPVGITEQMEGGRGPEQSAVFPPTEQAQPKGAMRP